MKEVLPQYLTRQQLVLNCRSTLPKPQYPCLLNAIFIQANEIVVIRYKFNRESVNLNFEPVIFEGQAGRVDVVRL